ncbi:doxX family protein [Asticcacaulis biprosthecium C19]|uniref:DoxX family protein n=1 Tax=Asticcacaulis biprosthecium C19 TaxID=715226 RepID=F4QHI8_9CAUL|nr:DoxX family protein [Asticcacaulis biprosthecium]EGF92725.1 doxX family protein [Asticcacaulis biprosthecium C19]
MTTLLTAYNQFETRLLGLGWLKGLSLLAIRIYLAQFFFFAGLTKIQSWPATIALFTDEYKVPLLPPDLAAVMAAAGELTLPVLLLVGLLSRIAAAGLFAMTLVIAVFVYPGYAENYFLLLLSFAIVAHGGGLFSIDHWLGRKR